VAWARSVLTLAVIGLGLSAGTRPVQADLWDTLVSGSVTASQIDVTRGDQTGLTWRGGPQLALPSGGGGPVLRVEAGGGGGCGITDFVGEFKAMFSTQALESYFEGLAGAALASAPLVLLCYASPTLCDAYKHFKQMSSEVLNLRAGECRAVEQAAANLGTSLNRQQQLACIDDRIAAGDPSWVALDACKAQSQATTLDYLLQRVGTFNVVESALQAVGADTETAAFAKTLLGDVRFTGGRWAAEPAGSQAAEGLWGSLFAQAVDRLTAAVESVSGGGRLGASDIAAISVPGVPLSEPILARLAVLPPAERQLAIQKLATALTLARLEYLLQTTEDQLRQAAAHPSQTPQRAALEERIEALHRAQARFRALKQNADSLTDVLAAIEHAAHAHEGRTVGETAPRGPQTPAPVSAAGERPWLGGGLELSPP
jgi:hypothetical protein